MSTAVRTGRHPKRSRRTPVRSAHNGGRSFDCMATGTDGYSMSGEIRMGAGIGRLFVDELGGWWGGHGGRRARQRAGQVRVAPAALEPERVTPEARQLSTTLAHTTAASPGRGRRAGAVAPLSGSSPQVVELS
jgi:hypothetical protein